MKKIFLLVMAIFAINTFSQAQDFKFFGFSQHWINFYQDANIPAGSTGIAENTWGFVNNRARLAFKNDMNDMFGITAILEFAKADKVNLDFFANVRLDPLATFKLGQIQPHTQSWESTISPADLKFYEYADVSLKTSAYCGFDALRDVGLQFFGKNNWMSYALFIGNGQGRFNFAGADKYIKNRKLGQALYGARLDFYPDKGLRIGGNINISKQDSVNLNDKYYNIDKTIYSAGFEINGWLWEPLIAELEYAAGKVNDKDFAHTTANTGKTFDLYGMYTTLGVKILKELHVLARYENYNEDYNDGLYYKTAKIYSGLSWYFFKENKEVAKLALNYCLSNLKYDGNTGGVYTTFDKNYNSVVLLLQLRY